MNSSYPSLKPIQGWRSVQSPNGWSWLNSLRRNDEADESLLLDTARSPKMARLEAALFVADGALSISKLAKTSTLENAKEAASLIEQLNELYDADGSSFRIEQVATGVQMLTRPEFSVWLDRIHNRQANLKLSSPAMETLAIIAYRQPCTRADIEAVRGVACSEMIKQLMERNLVRITGEDDSLGRPYLYGTTKLFLESFGVQNLKNLPMADLLAPKKPIEPEVPAQEEMTEENTSEEATTEVEEKLDEYEMDGEIGVEDLVDAEEAS